MPFALTSIAICPPTLFTLRHRHKHPHILPHIFWNLCLARIDRIEQHNRKLILNRKTEPKQKPQNIHSERHAGKPEQMNKAILRQIYHADNNRKH